MKGSAVQTLSDHHLTTPSAYTPSSDQLNEDQHNLRVLIDEVATTRGLTLQMSMRLLAYHAAPDNQTRDAVRDEFQAMADHFKRNLVLVFGIGPFEDLPQLHVDLIRKAAANNPKRKTAMNAVLWKVEEMARVLSDLRPLSFAQARSFFDCNWPVVRDQMTQVIWDVWADIDATREHHLEETKLSANALGTRLTRLEHIGKHVRLVSLNASVEAARAGDVGKGLMVIAREFKSLAEEIQSLAKAARADMDAIS